MVFDALGRLPPQTPQYVLQAFVPMLVLYLIPPLTYTLPPPETRILKFVALLSQSTILLSPVWTPLYFTFWIKYVLRRLGYKIGLLPRILFIIALSLDNLLLAIAALECSYHLLSDTLEGFPRW